MDAPALGWPLMGAGWGDTLGASVSAAGAGAAVGSVIPGIGTLLGAGIGFAAPIIGKLIGDALGAGDKAKAQAILQESYARFGPDVLKQPSIAQLTPHLDTSQLAQARADPESIAAQRGALASLKRYGEASPNDIEQRAGVDAATNAANQQAAAQNGALRNEMQARGRGNTGAEYATRALENQQSSERAAEGGFAAAADSKRSALQALQGYGSLAGQMRGQSFGEEATRGSAADETARFNEENKAKGAEQAFVNQFGVAQAQANAGANVANMYTGNAANAANTGTAIGVGVRDAAATAGNYFDSQQPKKKPAPGPWAGGYDSGGG